MIQDGKIIRAKGYGVAEQGGERPVTASTLFQAGSISKSVAALGRCDWWKRANSRSMKT